MRNFAKKISILLILGFIFGFSILIHSNLIYFQGKNNGSIEKQNKPELKRAGYWEIGPIFIDDADPLNNWAITAATYDWCSGNGTWNNPYVLENITIDGGYIENCIEVINSYRYFRIQNCTVLNSGREQGHQGGIRLENTSNGTLIYNDCSYNSAGISLYWCLNITISNNFLSENIDRGLSARMSSYIFLKKNVMVRNDWDGALFSASANNSIESNSFIENGQVHSPSCANGLYLHASNTNISKNLFKGNVENGINSVGSKNNLIESNDFVENNENGIHFYSSSNNNTFISNNCTNNGDSGIKIEYNSMFNNIVNNDVSSNFYGINIEDGYNNLVIGNIVYSNDVNAKDDGENNQWDNGTIGNYWSDYFGIDSDGDGIGNTPYNISGTAASQDHFPICNLPDEIPPVIIINLPNNNQVFGHNAPTFDITVQDDSPIDSTWYTVGENLTQYFFIGRTGTINQEAWNFVSEGIVIITFYALDIAGNTGTKSVLVIKRISSQVSIPGYNLLMVLGITSILTAIVIKKRQNYLN